MGACLVALQIGRLALRSSQGLGRVCDAESALTMLRTELSPDFRRLTVIGESSPDSAQGGAAWMTEFSTPVLCDRAAELLSLSQSGCSILQTMHALQAAVAACSRSLEDAHAAFSEKLNEFTSLLRDHACDASPADELLSLLLTGVARCAALRRCTP